MLAGLAHLFAPPFFNQWDPTLPSSVLSARAHLVNKLRAEGPFDGVLAFSDGAALAATVMIHDASICHHEFDGIDPTPASQHFKFAIFIASFPPYDSTGRKRLDVRLAGGPQIHCPTIHIVGNMDPFRSLARLTQELCDRDTTSVVRWDGHHEAPGWSKRSVCATVASELKEALRVDEECRGIIRTNGTNGMIDGRLSDTMGMMTG